MSFPTAGKEPEPPSKS